MTDDPLDNPLELDPMQLNDPTERARLIFIHWHVDEVITGQEAAVYAARLIERLKESGVEFQAAAANPMAHRIERDHLAGFDLVGYRLPDGRLRLGPDANKGQIVDDWPKEATFSNAYYTYTLESVRKNNCDAAGAGIEWGEYV